MQERSETQKQLKADEIFFDETKQSCSAKAALWSSRSQSRTEELAAIDEAIGILTSDEAKATFENSTSTFFLQVSERTEPAKERAAAFAAPCDDGDEGLLDWPLRHGFEGH